MSRRMMLLLTALAIVIAIATVQYWPEPSKPPHLATLSVDELVARLVDEERPLHVCGELATRGWLGGPGAIE
ncbi:MAG: hypothetical protein KAI24_20805 [Planctomycetes bacterium]|nr:hypothetical protein [Planctomycetota bacterium]